MEKRGIICEKLPMNDERDLLGAHKDSRKLGAAIAVWH